ncbi:hypothetical protein PRJ39_25270 [Lysobacter enzymogenes]|uniref:HNH endonuclease n=1 Tax=Lysobacter enzymogenes TaxID=69 RepID=UPI00374850A3
MQWIDLALISGESNLVSTLEALERQERKVIADELFGILGLSQDDFELSTLRILVERARGFALPISLWSRPLDASSSIRDAGRSHLGQLGLEASSSRLDAIQFMYQEFATERARVPVTVTALSKNGFRCEHCGLAFCNEDLESKGIVSPHGYRGALKVDVLKVHWQRDEHRIPTMDHDWPVSTFGSNADHNLRVLCAGCNEGKAAYLALEQMGAWTGLLNRVQLVSQQVPLALFYAQIRRDPVCSRTGVASNSAELTVELRDPARPAIFDNLKTVVSPDA